LPYAATSSGGQSLGTVLSLRKDCNVEYKAVSGGHRRDHWPRLYARTRENLRKCTEQLMQGS
jgi:hypothetical protein